MKTIYIILLTLTFVVSQTFAEEVKCNTSLQKLKPACNIGKVFDGLKKFSAKHKTIDQSLGVNQKDKNKFNLKEFSKKHRTITDTIKSNEKK
jgi:DICT domain-containing protein